MTIEDEADKILRESVCGQRGGLRKIGILDKKRLYTVHTREIPLSRFRRPSEKEDEE